MLTQCKNGKRLGWSWLDSGVCYVGPNARQLALRDGISISLEERRKGKDFSYAGFEDIDSQELSKYLSLVGASYEEAVVIIAGRK